jgi:hypothetical protein
VVHGLDLWSDHAACDIVSDFAGAQQIPQKHSKRAAGRGDRTPSPTIREVGDEGIDVVDAYARETATARP